MPPPLFELQSVGRTHQLGTHRLPILRDLDLTIERGELAAIAGPSGSGKTTLLHLLGGLDEPSSGRVIFDGMALSDMPAAERVHTRRRKIGFVFQSFHLLPVLSALENVEYPLSIDGVPRTESRRRATEMLLDVGLRDRLGHRPDQLSGGERQRVAIARALVHRPLALLADEPTASLDASTAESIVALLIALHLQLGMTLVVATHDPSVLARLTRRVTLRDGRAESDTVAPRAASAR